MLPKFINSTASLKDLWAREAKKVNHAHIVLASGKLVLQKVQTMFF